MTQKTDNELIAEFMGVSNPPVYDGGVWVGYYSPEDLEYHTSWDWLMPVIERIENYGHPTYTRNAEISIKEGSVISSRSIVSVMEGRSLSKIQSYYKAVIEFIKWYNKEKASAKTPTTQVV